MRRTWYILISAAIMLRCGLAPAHQRTVAVSGSPSLAQPTPTTAEILFAGAPLVQNFAKTNYLAGNQNWSASCGSNGMMYFANSDGLLSFDGQHWQLNAMPGKILVRSVAVDQQGQIYSGGFGQFGIWKKDAFGQLVYHSLSDRLAEKDQLHDEIWKIYVDSSRVLFQSFSAIYTYQNGELSVFKTKDPFLFLYQVHGRYLVEVLSKGLFEFSNGKLTPLIKKEQYGSSIILSILPFGTDQLLIGTAQKGLFLLSGNKINPWVNEANHLLSQYQLNNGLKILKDRYAFGTILNGIYMIDQDGHLLQHINKRNGLQNNTVLSLQQDQQKNIWVGLDNGIDRIEVNSPIYYYDDRSGILGTVYTAKIYQGYLYLGTNQGLYKSPWPAQHHQFDFHLVEGSQGQVWDLFTVDNELLCGHNNGTFRLNNGQPQWLSTVTGGYALYPLLGEEGRLIQGTYTGLVLFKKEKGHWNFEQKIAGFNEPAQYLQQSGNRKIWVSGYKGLYQIQLDSTQTSVVQQRKYGVTEGLPQSPYINVFDLSGRTVFATDSGFYLHDEIADSFHVYNQLNERLGTFAHANKVIPTDDGKYWFIRKGHLALVDFGKGGNVHIDSTQFTVLQNRMLNFYENINSLAPHLSLISLDDGFALYRKSLEPPVEQIGSPLVQQVEDIRDSTAKAIAFHGQGEVVLEAQQRDIRITYALPYFTTNEVLFQYQLIGQTDNWSAWSVVTQKEFTNLAPGNYVFKVRARVDGKETPVRSLTFEILPPWYKSFWAYMVYGISLLLLLYVLRIYERRRLQKHREEVRRKTLQEQEEHLLKEKAVNEQRLIKLKNAQLEKELASKNRELANSAMNIVYKNELLNNVHDELLQLKDSEGRKLSGDQLKKISKIIDDARSDERDWNLFEESFNEAHENFFKKLKTNYPELVPNDLKLCAYLRMNMSSKEIASLLNITTRGVEIRRYRLRKKLNLEHDKSLVEFLLEI